MIDFGRSFMGDKTDFSKCGDKYILAHVHLSKWELRDCRLSFRDDVYRAVQVSAMVIYRAQLFRYIQTIADKAREARMPNSQLLRDIKESASFFQIKGRSGLVLANVPLTTSIARGSPELLEQIEGHLSIISAEASRDTLGLLDKPNYKTIIDAYRSIILLLDPSLSGQKGDEIFRI